MSFDWKEYLGLAQFLKNCCGGNFSQEASSRSSVSRAYYAAFCFSRNNARDNLGFTPENKSSDHVKLREFLKTESRSKEATRLEQLRQWRNECDYEDIINSTRLSIILNQSTIIAKDIIDNI
jgi:hypothetical protein